MSINCRIKNNKVFAPNNEPSILFSSLENKFGREKALDMYALTETEEYKVALTNTDSNGEMLLNDFIKFSLEKPATKNYTQETIDLQLRAGRKGIQVLKENLFQNGIVSITRENLERSNIFTPDEIENILSSETTQENLEEFIKNSDTLEIPPLEETYLVLEDTYNSIGIKPYKNPTEVKREVLEVLSEANTVEEVYNLINTIEYPTIIEDFKNNPSKRISIIEDALNTKQVEKTYESDYVEKTLLNTLDVSNLDTIEQISANILQLEDNDLIVEEFLSLVDSLRASGLDINIDTYDAYNRSQTDIKNLAQSIIDFSKKPDRQNTQKLSFVLQPFMNLESTALVNTSNLSNKVNNLTVLETDKNEIEVFEKRGFIRHTENLYQKIDDKYSTEQLYEILYDKVLEGIVNIPTPSIESLEQLNEPANKQVVKKDIRDYIKEQTNNLPEGNTNTQEKIAIYKTYYNAPTKLQQNIETKVFVRPIAEGIENEGYLKNDFVSDFSKFINYNKDRQTTLYKNLLQFFKVDKDGIKLKDNSRFVLQQVKNNLSLLDSRVEKDLLNYNRLSKKLRLPVDNEVEMLKYNNQDFKRTIVAENPYYLPELNKNYSEVTQSDIVVENSKDPFIRVKSAAYEKTQEIDNVSLYSKLPTPNNNYINTNIQRPDPQLTYEDFKSYVKEENPTTVNQIVGDIELEEINENYFKC